jgi:hypothetical protein
MNKKIVLLTEEQKELNRLAEMKTIHRACRKLKGSLFRNGFHSRKNDITLVEKHVSFTDTGLYEGDLTNCFVGPHKLSEELSLYSITGSYTFINPELFSHGFVFNSDITFQGCSFVWLEAVIKGETKLITYHDSSPKLTNLTKLLEHSRTENWGLQGGVVISPIRAHPEKNGFPFAIYKYPMDHHNINKKNGLFNFIITRHGFIMQNDDTTSGNPFTEKFITWQKIGWQPEKTLNQIAPAQIKKTG